MKDKALKHVRSVCTELKDDDVVDLRHWLRGMPNGAFLETRHSCHKGKLVVAVKKPKTKLTVYNLTKDGENQSKEFYKAYCEIVGIINPN